MDLWEYLGARGIGLRPVGHSSVYWSTGYNLRRDERALRFSKRDFALFPFGTATSRGIVIADKTTPGTNVVRVLRFLEMHSL